MIDYNAIKRNYRSSIKSAKDFTDALSLISELNIDNIHFKGIEEIAIVSCPLHGVFSAPALGLLIGQYSCRACMRESNFGITEEKLKKSSVVYVLLIEGLVTQEKFIKVGVSLSSWRRAHSITRTTKALYKALPLAECRFNTGVEAYAMEMRILKLLDTVDIPFFPKLNILKGASECFQEKAYLFLKEHNIIGNMKNQLREINEERTVFSLAKRDTGVGRMEIVKTKTGIWSIYTAGMINKYGTSTKESFLLAIIDEGKLTKDGTLMNTYLKNVYKTVLIYFKTK